MMANKMRLIDQQPIVKFIKDGLNNPDPKQAFGHDAIKILAEIEYAPTVDAVPVVRCKDCKHWKIWESNYGVAEAGYCRCHEVDAMEAVDFCSYGERRSDG